MFHSQDTRRVIRRQNVEDFFFYYYYYYYPHNRPPRSEKTTREARLRINSNIVTVGGKFRIVDPF